MTSSNKDTRLDGMVRFAICGVCRGEFDEAEWDADTRCPECESPKQRAGTRIAPPSVSEEKES